ncbi:RNA-binding protein 33 [Camelus dromedarius]|uniref:RNA-binding protein 33 n=1 Tax=Camelus dromedarius TaxID=9838 RepID=A0A5N4E0H8_CAMDR|nr:RNA-binding protein 33 [Camelus dromedarius]
MSNSRCSSTPAAQVKPTVGTSAPTRPGAGPRSTQGKAAVTAKPASPVVQPKEEAKTEPEHESRYRQFLGQRAWLCSGETLRLSQQCGPEQAAAVLTSAGFLSYWVCEPAMWQRSVWLAPCLVDQGARALGAPASSSCVFEILKQKELRRQQQAGARKKELLERLAQQQQLCPPAAPAEPEEPTASPSPTNGTPLLPFPGAQSPAQHKALQVKPADGEGLPPPSQTARVKPGAKRTVMHRASSGGGDGPHVSSKVRVIKLSGGVS